MMQQILLGFGGSATTSTSLQYADDMFSTFLYDGQYSNLEVNNNVDLSNDGGLVWFKNRDYSRIHSLFDSVFILFSFLDFAIAYFFLYEFSKFL